MARNSINGRLICNISYGTEVASVQCKRSLRCYISLLFSFFLVASKS